MKRIQHIILFLTFSFFALPVFSQTKFFSTNGKEIKMHHAKKKAIKAVVIYLDKSELPKGSERIGLITCRAKRRETAYWNSKSVCAEAGGNAILQLSAKDMDTGDKVAKFFLGGRKFNGDYEFAVYRLPEEKAN